MSWREDQECEARETQWPLVNRETLALGLAVFRADEPLGRALRDELARRMRADRE